MPPLSRSATASTPSETSAYGFSDPGPAHGLPPSTTVCIRRHLQQHRCHCSSSRNEQTSSDSSSGDQHATPALETSRVPFVDGTSASVGSGKSNGSGGDNLERGASAGAAAMSTPGAAVAETSRGLILSPCSALLARDYDEEAGAQPNAESNRTAGPPHVYIHVHSNCAGGVPTTVAANGGRYVRHADAQSELKRYAAWNAMGREWARRQRVLLGVYHSDVDRAVAGYDDLAAAKSLPVLQQQVQQPQVTLPLQATPSASASSLGIAGSDVSLLSPSRHSTGMRMSLSLVSSTSSSSTGTCTLAQAGPHMHVSTQSSIITNSSSSSDGGGGGGNTTKHLAAEAAAATRLRSLGSMLTSFDILLEGRSASFGGLSALVHSADELRTSLDSLLNLRDARTQASVS
ncbi:hypothetical protein K437DRAFT_266489 [Tilletiaria anomala UBC 951]|uniref:Uncharacterized protein n=1 Tax=Tilletiaria anomala (strain ATCC 24038 / CBS 436.72 / UBC 951) TaxID=1037660 RepID=A0A066WNQ8_TILAU|nr:uncharacterized protein K437DRAFT_266489 [Tilletiaria anomala UBC 951]KDN52639.1 hypothetical protein K437DRAFT_266489 [Tilletiaria anomala UBC 951]